MRNYLLYGFGLLTLVGCSTGSIRPEKMPTPQEVVSCATDADCTTIEVGDSGCLGRVALGTDYALMVDAHREQFGIRKPSGAVCGMPISAVTGARCENRMCKPICTSTGGSHEQVDCGKASWPPQEWPKVNE